MRLGWWRSPARGAAVCAGLAGLLLGYARLGSSYGYVGTPIAPRPAPALPLIDDRGAPFDLARLRGKAVLVYFGYTHCPDVCPTTLARLAPVFQALGVDRSRTVVLFVTLDPARDDPAALHAYLAAFDPVPVGLTGSASLLNETARRWSVAWRPAQVGAYVDHASVVTLVDPQGRLRVRYGLSQLADPAAMAHDIEHVLAG